MTDSHTIVPSHYIERVQAANVAVQESKKISLIAIWSMDHGSQSYWIFFDQQFQELCVVQSGGSVDIQVKKTAKNTIAPMKRN